MVRIVSITLAALLMWSLSCSSALAAYSIVIDKGVNRLTLYDGGEVVKTFPVATGRSPSLTPEGSFTIVNKLVNPYYAKKNIPGGSPRNPLGPRWMGLSYGGGGEYGIHGNSDPSSIGKYVSAGCIRLRNEDVIWLFDRVPVGTPVKIVNLRGQNTPPVINYTVFVDGSALSLGTGQKPVVSGGVCLVPVRPVIEAMGYSGAWVESENRFDIKEGRCIISIWANSARVTVDSRPVSLPAGPVLPAGGSLCVHPQFFSAVMGGGCAIDQKGNIKITSPLKFLAGSGFLIPAAEK